MSLPGGGATTGTPVGLADLVVGDELLHARHEVHRRDARTDPGVILSALEMPEGHHREEDQAPDERDGDPHLFLLAGRSPPGPRRSDDRGVRFAVIHVVSSRAGVTAAPPWEDSGFRRGPRACRSRT